MDMKNGEDWRKKVKRERNKQTEREGTKELGLITLSVETSFHIFMTPQSRFSKIPDGKARHTQSVKNHINSVS